MQPVRFTTIAQPKFETMDKLDWDHPVNLIGQKVETPTIHCCDTCTKPILIYGRLVRKCFVIIIFMFLFKTLTVAADLLFDFSGGFLISKEFSFLLVHYDKIPYIIYI